MKVLKRRIALLLAALCCAVLLFGCGNASGTAQTAPTNTTEIKTSSLSSEEKLLVGTWYVDYYAEGGGDVEAISADISYIFDKDHTGRIEYGNDSITGTWEYEKYDATTECYRYLFYIEGDKGSKVYLFITTDPELDGGLVAIIGEDAYIFKK